jgi:hypothetical protein
MALADEPGAAAAAGLAALGGADSATAAVVVPA